MFCSGSSDIRTGRFTRRSSIGWNVLSCWENSGVRWPPHFVFWSLIRHSSTSNQCQFYWMFTDGEQMVEHHHMINKVDFDYSPTKPQKKKLSDEKQTEGSTKKKTKSKKTKSTTHKACVLCELTRIHLCFIVLLFRFWGRHKRRSHPETQETFNFDREKVGQRPSVEEIWLKSQEEFKNLQKTVKKCAVFGEKASKYCSDIN